MKMMESIFGKANPELHEAMAVVALARPALKSAKLEAKPADPKGDAYLNEYAELAGVIGIMPPDLAIESFKAFMVAHDLPIYSLSEVIAYMDDRARKESKEQAGWEWRPLREKDHLLNIKFGKAAEWSRNHSRENMLLSPASDYYLGPHTRRYQTNDGHEKEHIHDSLHKPYDRTIPLHAVRRVALIEKEHKGPVAFFVSDYALAPAISHPDPFLLAVVPNLNVGIGTGRFVIDFWDEPGFGIDKMLK